MDKTFTVDLITKQCLHNMSEKEKYHDVDTYQNLLEVIDSV